MHPPGVIYLRVAADGLIQEASEDARGIFGDVVGQSVDALAGIAEHADLRAGLPADVRRQMSDRLIPVGGRWYEVGFGPANEQGGRDVWLTDRTKENLHRRLLELGLDLACTATDGLHFDYLSPAWENTLGWTLDELRAKPFVEFVHPDDVESTAELAGEMLNNGGLAVMFRNRYRHRDGRWIWLEWMGRVSEDTFWASARDVTAQVEQEAQLARMAREMEQFAYAAAHDLKAPLRRVSSLASSAEHALKQGDVEKVLKRMAQIRSAGEHGAAIVEAALEYARLGGTLDLDVVDVEDVVDGALRGLGAALTGMTVVQHGPEGAMGRLNLAGAVACLTNLLDNACKYAPCGRVSITWGKTRGGGAWIAVDDDGRGFPPEFAERLWEPTWRGVGDVPGHGFGLAKVRRLVESMGGKVVADSPGEGKGATFRLEFRA